MWLIPKSHFNVANSKKSYYDVTNSKRPTTMWLTPKSHYDVANSKPAMMKHNLQSPLLRGNTLQNFKIIFTKPKFLFGIYFHKAQILIWHYKAQILSWQFLHKAQILIWRLSLHYFYKSPNANLASILQNLKPF